MLLRVREVKAKRSRGGKETEKTLLHESRHGMILYEETRGDAPRRLVGS